MELVNTLSLRFSLNVRDHISEVYSTTGNFLYILIFKILEKTREAKMFELNNKKHFLPDYSTSIKKIVSSFFSINSID